MLKTSVIIPTYNRANYLTEALRSVFSQSPSPWEVIVIDDGSSDNTDEVVREFGPGVSFLQLDHQGISEARTFGLQTAQGDVIAWLDSDDVWEPGFLATVLSILEADERVDGVYTGLSRIDGDGNPLPQPGLVVVPPEELYTALADDCFIQTSTFVARKRAFDGVGGFDPAFKICEDYDMFLRLAEKFTIVGVPELLVRYRIHLHNTVANVEAFCHYRLALTAKHFGQPVGDPRSWPTASQRAHGHAFRAAAYKCIQGHQMDDAWRYLERAFSTWPALLTRLDTFFELACGDQPPGYRGHAASLDIDGNATQMLGLLDRFFVSPPPDVASLRATAFGNAYLALAILSDQAERWGAARRYLVQAGRADPRLFTSVPVLRRFAKLCAGHRLVALGRKLRGSRQSSQNVTHPTGAGYDAQTSH
jgi:glycosyltransferase involved in cell wall biosynthesis